MKLQMDGLMMDGRMNGWKEGLPTFKQEASDWNVMQLMVSVVMSRVLCLALADSQTSSWFTHLDAFALASIR